MTETILITGASGRVGKAAGSYLCRQGYSVIGVSRSIREDENCYTETSQVNLLEEEDLQRLEELMKEKEVDAVFHLAWNIPAENFDTHTAWEPNMDMFENVVEASRNAGVPIFINGSSIHAGTGDIGAYTVDADFEGTPQPYKDSIDPDTNFDLRKENPIKLLDPREENPDSPYGWSKIITERATREAVENDDFQIGVSIRIGGVTGDNIQYKDDEPYYSSLYWSHKDLGRTIENILTADTEEMQGYHQFYGVSDNEGRIFSIENDFI
jgi:nucleoside-diphosphate-sugar epimerase